MRKSPAAPRLLVFALAASLAACATSAPHIIGRDFPRAPFATFTLDSTSVAEAEAALGPPMKQTTVRGLVGANSKRLVPGTPYAITALAYFYFPNGPGLISRGHPGKNATLLFLDGRLIAYGADSTLPQDANPPIDESRLDSLHQCQTTRSEAIALLGQPDAEALHVLDSQPGAIDIAYSWQNTDPAARTRRSLRVFFDHTGAMSNYTLIDDTGITSTNPMLPRPPPAPCPVHAGRTHT